MCVSERTIAIEHDVGCVQCDSMQIPMRLTPAQYVASTPFPMQIMDCIDIFSQAREQQLHFHMF